MTTLTEAQVPAPAATSNRSTTDLYDDVYDPTQLRTAINELFDVIGEIDQIVDVTAQLPDTPLEWVAGAEEVKAVLLHRVKLARRRLNQLGGTHPPRPVVLDPSALPAIHTRQGQPLNPVITRPAVATDGISSAEVWMPPGHCAHAHVHHQTDLIVLLRDGKAITVWWDHNGERHELIQHPGQHLHIPHGVPHAAINPGSRPVIATEFRSGPIFDADTHRLPHLDPEVIQLPLARQSA
jgi:uncharacterized RmlC-like cupin family protein